MRLDLVRQTFTARSTIGKLSLDGRFECFTLEDPVRPEKIASLTAIPAGTYGIEITFSPRFRTDLPLLLDVPDFTGVRIHSGNSPEHTEGCILVGRTAAVDFVGNSRAAFAALFAKLRSASSAAEELSIEIANRGRSPYEDPRRTEAALTPRGTVYRVSADVVRLRSTPDKATGDNVVGRLPLGHLVVKRGNAKDPAWTRVATLLEGRDRTGYVHGSYLEAVPGQQAPQERGARRSRSAQQPTPTKGKPPELYRVNASRLNLRKGPKDFGDDSVLAMLPRGQLVAKTGTERGRLWWEIETVLHGTKLSGFVHSGLLTPLVGPTPLGPPHPSMTMLSGEPTAPGELGVTDRAIQLILDFEGMNQPGKWPGEMSGITIGHGYDLGYCTHDEFFSDWEAHLPQEWMQRLEPALSKRGAPAERIAPRFADIVIARKAADTVFLERTIPQQRARAAAAFPGAQALPADCQGALVSLVYNRGASMQGDRRREMREIRDCVANAELPIESKLERIAASLESMKRLWPDSRGLRRRRDAEAAMVRSAA